MRLGVGAAAQRHLHVRLARAEPYLADENVLHHDGGFASLAAGDGHLERAAGFEPGQARRPLAAGVSGREPGLAVELDGDLLGGIGYTPDGHRHAALQHHVIAEEWGGLDLGGCERRKPEGDRERWDEGA